MRMDLARISRVQGVGHSTRDLSQEQLQRLRDAIRPLWLAAKERGESQETFAGRFGVQQPLFSSFINGRGGFSIVSAKRAIRVLHLNERDVLGDDLVSDDDLSPKERALALLGRHVSNDVRERYNALKTWQATPDGGRVDRDEIYFAKKLVQFIEDERDDASPVPPGAEIIQAGDAPSTPPPPRRARAVRRRG